jgi:hypothetical protein
MKGFIEVYERQDRQTLVSINIAEIEMFYNKHICIRSRTFPVQETYSELKALIEAAMETNECDDCPYNDARVELPKNYEIPELEGTTDALNHLGIRKEK